MPVAMPGWQTTLHTLENVNVANMFGETADFTISLATWTPTEGHSDRQDHRIWVFDFPRDLEIEK